MYRVKICNFAELYCFLQIVHVFLKYGQKLKITRKDHKPTRKTGKSIILSFISGAPAAWNVCFSTGFFLYFLLQNTIKNIKLQKKGCKFTRKAGKTVILRFIFGIPGVFYYRVRFHIPIFTFHKLLCCTVVCMPTSNTFISKEQGVL